MKNLKKKGFTIVELVIVIAVIAILSAVLIPTFSNLIKKANLSADQQAVRQMNSALIVVESADTIEEVINALAEQGYNSKKTLVPVSTGYSFFWYEGAKKVVLVQDQTVVFPEGVEYEENGISLEGSIKLIDVNTDDTKELYEAFQNSNEEITLTGNVSIGNGEMLVVKSDADMSLDLASNTLSAELQGGHADKHNNVIEVNGKLTIKNGTIDTRNILVNPGSELILENVTVNALDLDGGACLFMYQNSKVLVKSGTFNSSSFTYAIRNGGGELIIEDATITAGRGCIATSENGKTTINGGTYTVLDERTDAAHVIYLADGEVVINGGTFENQSPIGQKFCVDQAGTGSIKLEDGTIIQNNN